jgi:inward rectifier potassium channel
MKQKPPISGPQFRLAGRLDRLQIQRLGRGRRHPFADIFHWLMNRHWWQLIGLLFFIFVITNLIYAFAYYVLPDAIANAHQSSFLDYFFFSVQTMATIGYGLMVPHTLAANIVASSEAFTGLLGFAMGSGLILARFARPTAKIMFSQLAVISKRNSEDVFMVRLANERDNQILEGAVSLTYLSTVVTHEGERLRRFLDMRLERERTPIFSLTWTIVHPIDSYSPLFNKTADDLRAEEAEILVTFRGVDETFSQEIYARDSYVADEIRWRERFVDIVGTNDQGQRTINFARFHETQPWAH